MQCFEYLQSNFRINGATDRANGVTDRANGATDRAHTKSLDEPENKRKIDGFITGGIE